MRHDTPFKTRQESGVPCLKMRRSLAPLLKLYRKPKIPVAPGEEAEFPASTQDEVLFPCGDSRGILTCLSNLKVGMTFPRQNEMFLVVPNNWKGIPSFPQQLEKNHEISPQCGMRPFPLQHLESNLEFPLENRKEAELPL